jgi:hypothetical protein
MVSYVSLKLMDGKSIGNRQLKIGNVQRPLEPDTVNTVEGRNSQT